MILRSPLSIPPNPLAGPRKIGDDTDYIEIDPANGQVNTSGMGSPLTIEDLTLDVWRPPAGGGSDYTRGLTFALQSAAGLNMLSTRCYVVPCVIPRAVTVDQIVIQLKTGSDGKVARCGIWSGDAKARLAQSVQFAVATGDQGIISAAISYAFSPGYYLLAIAADGEITLAISFPHGSQVLSIFEDGGSLRASFLYYLTFSFSAGGDLPTDVDPTAYIVNNGPPILALRPVA